MTYQLTLTNDYVYDVTVAGTTVAKSGGTWKSGGLGSTIVTVPGRGELAFQDVGDDHGVGGFCQETWGVLISYQGDEAVFRYEGGGELSAVINKYGQVTLGSNFCISYPQLPSFTDEG
jgi:hypothetical protein